MSSNHYLSLLLITTIFALSHASLLGRECISDEVIICVTNDAERFCEQSSNATTNVNEVSQVMRRFSASCFTLYFTSGNHSLEGGVIFHTHIEIVGVVDNQTKIECEVGQVDFSGRYNVLIRNALFQYCYITFQDIGNLTLENVTIKYAEHGLFVSNCLQVVIKKCTFVENREGQVIVRGSPISLLVDQSLFYNGRSFEGSAGLKTIITSTNCHATENVIQSFTTTQANLEITC